jgi:hypothetical protein
MPPPPADANALRVCRNCEVDPGLGAPPEDGGGPGGGATAAALEENWRWNCFWKADFAGESAYSVVSSHLRTSEMTDPRPAHTTHQCYASVTNTDEVRGLLISSVCKHGLAQPLAPGPLFKRQLIMLRVVVLRMPRTSGFRWVGQPPLSPLAPPMFTTGSRGCAYAVHVREQARV